MFLFASLVALSSPVLSSSAPLPEVAAPAVQGGAEAEEPDTAWHGSVNVGINATSGNTQTTTAAVSASAERAVGDDRYGAKAYYNYTENRATDETIQDNRGLNLRYNRFLNERLYALATADAVTDEIASLDLRTALTVGAGYQVYDTEEFDLRGELGVAMVDEDYSIDASDTDYTASSLSAEANWVANEDLTLGYSVQYLQSLDNSDDLIIVSDLKASTSLGESMIGTFQWMLNYDNTPVAGNDREDNRFIVSVGWTF